MSVAVENKNYRDRKYRDDSTFQKINRMFLTLKGEEIKEMNQHLKMIENKFIPTMKKDELFAAMYQRIIYGGSFYKRTKYGSPEEFDLDIIIKLPIRYDKIRIDVNHGEYGFVKINIDTANNTNPTWIKHSKTLSKWINRESYLIENKFRNWIESVFTSAFDVLPKSGGYYLLDYNGNQYKVKHKKSGPAFTLNVTTPTGYIFDVDIVPCLEFVDKQLGYGYRQMKGNRNNWLAIAKPLQGAAENILWRLSFYEQEKDFLEGEIKPVIRMMKKLRDSQNMYSICSYFIETVFYHILDRQSDLAGFLNAPKTWIFMYALKELADALGKHELKYFWHPDYNLLKKITPFELTNHANRLNRLISDVDRRIETDRNVLAEIVLSSDELEKWKKGEMLENQMSNLGISKPEEQFSRCILS